MLSDRGSRSADESIRLAPDRVSTPRFDSACALAITHLSRVAPLGMWRSHASSTANN
jgi:hypothetical protein